MTDTAINWENMRNECNFKKWQLELQYLNIRDQAPDPLKTHEYLIQISREDYKQLLEFAIKGVFEELETPYSKAQKINKLLTDSP